MAPSPVHPSDENKLDSTLTYTLWDMEQRTQPWCARIHTCRNWDDKCASPCTAKCGHLHPQNPKAWADWIVIVIFSQGMTCPTLLTTTPTSPEGVQPSLRHERYLIISVGQETLPLTKRGFPWHSSAFALSLDMLSLSFTIKMKILWKTSSVRAY